MTATDNFTCWAVMPNNVIKRFEVEASCQAEAVRMIFNVAPSAQRVSARESKFSHPLMQLRRRADPGES